MSATSLSAFGKVDFRSRCTPKTSMPARASARLVAAPKPEEAPRTSAQPESRIGSASLVIALPPPCRLKGASILSSCLGGKRSSRPTVLPWPRHGQDGGNHPHRQRAALRQGGGRERGLPVPGAP